MTTRKSTGPQAPEQSQHRKGGRPRKRKLTPREQMREQIFALGKTKLRRGHSRLNVSDCIELVRAILTTTGHKRAALLREFAEHKKISERHARRLLPEIAAAVQHFDLTGLAWARFGTVALAPFHALESSIARLDDMARKTTQNFDSLVARVTQAHKKIENQHRELIFHHPCVWKAATQVTTDPASLDVILNAWRDAPDDHARELVIKELEEIARAK